MRIMKCLKLPTNYMHYFLSSRLSLCPHLICVFFPEWSPAYLELIISCDEDIRPLPLSPQPSDIITDIILTLYVGHKIGAFQGFQNMNNAKGEITDKTQRSENNSSTNEKFMRSWKGVGRRWVSSSSSLN
ncbi:uncharacterized protein LOC127011548 [Drosophila biarmipes]|uniref:uncharacterized protein LOC127011548 n=1 Tax=Drosophila biarmipes TaxID=125945 RepID=UPI0021CC6108|nr:uncharacterized protein LOC127011548 [Drosophila biarmipes]